MTNKLAELSLAEKLLITGNILGSISMALISIGAILRKNNLPDYALFATNLDEASAT
ncbi:MAG: hypothetical protein PHY93_20520 [Bacteriovorax sp.]|nr:hypothetical protein [Bacteriovorax sp.]